MMPFCSSRGGGCQLTVIVVEETASAATFRGGALGAMEEGERNSHYELIVPITN